MGDGTIDLREPARAAGMPADPDCVTGTRRRCEPAG